MSDLKKVIEPAREVDVFKKTDVLVAGGGIGGFAAALAAARAGSQVILVERNGCLGGILTSNIIPNLCNHHLDAESRHQVFGVARELIERLVAEDSCVKRWEEHHAKIVFDEQRLKVVMIEMLQEAGVEVLTHCYAARPIMDGSRVTGLFIETKVGRQAILADVVVDATGEADIASQTGCPMRYTEGTATLAFKMSSVDMEAFVEYFAKHPDEFPGGFDSMHGFWDFELNFKEYGGFYFPNGGGRAWRVFQDAIAAGEYSKTRGKVFGMDMSCLIGLRALRDVSVNCIYWRLHSLEPDEVTEAELECQRTVYYVAEFFRKHVPGFKNAHVSQISQDLGIRISRGILGMETLTGEMVNSPTQLCFDTVIGVRSAVPFQFDKVDHPYDKEKVWAAKPLPEEKLRFHCAHTVDIPYGIIVPQNVDGLLAGSGKIVSCVPQYILRTGVESIMPGQAAGVAAAIASQKQLSPRELNVRDIQRELLKQGVFLGSDERLKQMGLR